MIQKAPLLDPKKNQINKKVEGRPLKGTLPAKSTVPIKGPATFIFIQSLVSYLLNTYIEYLLDNLGLS